MTAPVNGSDASFYYRETSAADFARMDSTIVYGNLADAMKDATTQFPLAEVTVTTLEQAPGPRECCDEAR